jgi:1-deoxy-D-xylulose-5-phosphate synthase
MKGEEGTGIAVIGDASITNGMAFEALNLIGNDHSLKGLIILNDNEMSISKSVGSISKALAKFRSMRLFMKVKNMWAKILPQFMIHFLGRIKRGLRGFFQRQNIFEDLGYMYIGPIDGHDLRSLVKNLERIKNVKKSVVLHIITEKGKGHVEAENDKVGTYHGVSKPSNGVKHGISWSEMIADIMMEIQKKDKTFVIMPAMEVGTHFSEFAKTYPDRYLDVGIAEEHAATMAGMLAHQQINVFLPLYATFAQRAFDQILNDIARSNHHVVFGIDRAGIVGEDGSTHQGLFDVSMFYLMPYVTITMPYDAKEAMDLLHYGFFGQKNPFVIRYPRGTVLFDRTQDLITFDEIKPTWVKLKEGDDVNLISYGPSLDLLIQASDDLNLHANVINARFIKPIDEDMLHEVMKTGKPVLVYEEAANTGSLYPQILKFMAKYQYHNRIIEMSITDQVVDHGNYVDMLKETHMDVGSIKQSIKDLLS